MALASLLGSKQLSCENPSPGGYAAVGLMIVAVPTDDKETISQHFGRAKYFVIAEISDGKLLSKKVVENPRNAAQSEQSGHGMLLKMLVENKVDRVFYQDIGAHMLENLKSLKIEAMKADASSIGALLVR